MRSLGFLILVMTVVAAAASSMIVHTMTVQSISETECGLNQIDTLGCC